jgi:uracil-DNA glycosylase
MNTDNLPADWQRVLAREFEKPYFAALRSFVDAERAEHTVFPPDADVLNALRLTPVERVRVVILGQDPYHDDGQAHGLAFSVLPEVRSPPSLANIFKELRTDVPGFQIPNNGNLVPWAEQGVLLINAVLTVRAHQANSHKGKGWETFTDAVLKAVSAEAEPTVFVLWGGYAAKKLPLIDEKKHVVIRSAHPSPLSAHNGFFGSRPFSQINARLEAWGKPPIDWNLPDL